jgi:hypothetical protein
MIPEMGHGASTIVKGRDLIGRPSQRLFAIFIGVFIVKRSYLQFRALAGNGADASPRHQPRTLLNSVDTRPRP